uniref:Uncharacterized protein n=1 Tax=Vitis vinifera TaxID=29760 RepID=F6GSW4_VITVI
MEISPLHFKISSPTTTDVKSQYISRGQYCLRGWERERHSKLCLRSEV